MCLIELADFEKQSPRPMVFQFGANPTADPFEKTLVNFLQCFVCGRSRARNGRKKSRYGDSRERNVGAKEIEVLDGGGKLEKRVIMVVFKLWKSNGRKHYYTPATCLPKQIRELCSCDN